MIVVGRIGIIFGLLVQVFALFSCFSHRREQLSFDYSRFNTQARVNSSELGPGDIIHINVYKEKELSGKYMIDSDGTIVFPFIGQIKISGMTPNQAAEKIASLLRGKYLKDPQVTIYVDQYNSKKVYVLGEVNKPGTFRYEDNMNIIQAITLAGGFSRYAAKNRTSVIRKIDGKEEKIIVPVEDIAEGKRPNFKLLPDDIIYVPESIF